MNDCNQSMVDLESAMKQQLKPGAEKLLTQAMRYAYESGDDYLTAFVSGTYDNFMFVPDQTEPAVRYITNSVDLYEKLQVLPKFISCVVLGEMLWKIKDYKKSIKYTALALSQLETFDKNGRDKYFIMCLYYRGNSPSISGGTPTVSYSIVQHPSIWPGSGNSNADLQFASDGGGNLRLTPCSPAINTGIPHCLYLLTIVNYRSSSPALLPLIHERYHKSTAIKKI